MQEAATIRGSTSAARSTAQRGYTLTEIVVVVGIISVLLGIAIVGGRAVFASRSRSLATQQLATIAGAVERYASFWPRWQAGTVVVADKGWPDPFPFRVFNTTRYQAMPSFNTHVEYRLAGNGSGVIEDLVDFSDPDRVVANDGTAGDVMAANVCLTYALLAETGKGPYLEHDDSRMLIRRVSEIDGGSGMATLPPPIGGSANVPAEVLVDPWGMPYRYFWVYRDSTSYRGYLPVPTADVTDAAWRKAVGFVMESAGPDRKFGNVWQTGVPSIRDRDEAEDNVTITP